MDIEKSSLHKTIMAIGICSYFRLHLLDLKKIDERTFPIQHNNLEKKINI